MRRVPQVAAAVATTAVTSGPASSSTSCAPSSSTSTAIPLTTAARPISFFGWKPYGGKGADGKGGGAAAAGEMSEADAREALKRRNSHVYKTKDGAVDENMMKEMMARGGSSEIISDDIPVRNLPKEDSIGDLNAPRDWSGAGSTSGGGDLVPTANNNSSSSASGGGDLATLEAQNQQGEVADFDVYKKSTITFMSSVNPNSLVGVGLGAGFGDVEDARFSYLRPSKKHGAARTPEEEEIWMKEQKRLGLMDPDEGDVFLDGSVYRPSKQGVQGLSLLGDTYESKLGHISRQNKAKYDAIDKAMRDGTYNYDQHTATNSADNALSTTANNEGGSSSGAVSSYGGLEAYSAERSYALAKSDEEKKAIRERQRRLAQLQLASALKRMSDWRGTTFATKEHFLLADLDFERDSLLFGRTREEFESNVKKMKRVVIDYTKWERRENAYKYATWVLKAIAAYMAFEIYMTIKARDMLITYYDEFTTVVAESINDLESQRVKDIDKAIDEMQRRPPDFKPLKAAIEKERKRLREERAAQIKEEAVNEELARRELALAKQRAEAALKLVGLNLDGEPTAANGIADDAETKKLRAEAYAAAQARVALADLSVPTKRHPMDTTGVEYGKAVQEVEGLKDALFKSDALAAQVRKVSPVDAGLSSDAAAADKKKGGNNTAFESAAAAMHKYLFFGGIRSFFHTDHRVSATPTAATDSNTPAGAANANAAAGKKAAAADGGMQTLMGVADTVTNSAAGNAAAPADAALAPKKKKLQPLTKAEEDELILTSMAYAVSPTSIEAVKQLRRTLLPRTEDFTTIVRQEMLEHRQSKRGVVVFPGSDKAEN